MIDWGLVIKVVIGLPVFLILLFVVSKIIFAAWFSAKMDHLKEFIKYSPDNRRDDND